MPRTFHLGHGGAGFGTGAVEQVVHCTSLGAMHKLVAGVTHLLCLFWQMVLSQGQLFLWARGRPAQGAWALPPATSGPGQPSRLDFPILPYGSPGALTQIGGHQGALSAHPGAAPRARWMQGQALGWQKEPWASVWDHPPILWVKASGGASPAFQAGAGASYVDVFFARGTWMVPSPHSPLRSEVGGTLQSTALNPHRPWERGLG